MANNRNKCVQAGSSPFKNYLSSRGIVVGLVVDAHDMNSLIDVDQFPAA
jgi:hypothetical protein